MEVPLHLIGSDFQREVWEILQTIPYGKTITYGDIAKQIATRRGLSRMSAQAVGGAVGHNPLSVIVPCHRVVGSNGNLTGYAGGIDKKEALLTLEGVEVSNHSISTSKKPRSHYPEHKYKTRLFQYSVKGFPILRKVLPDKS